MKSQLTLCLKIALVAWALFAQDYGSGFRYSDDPAQQSQCCGMRKLRDLFRTPAGQTPDSSLITASLSVNEDTKQR